MGDYNPEKTLDGIKIEDLEVLGNKAGVKIPRAKRTNEVQKDNLIKELVDSIKKEGMKLVVGVLKKKALFRIVSLKDFKLSEKWTAPDPPKNPKKDDKKKKKEEPCPSKLFMVKLLNEYLEANSIKDYREFFNKYSKDDLLTCCRDIDDLSDMSESELNKTSKEDFLNAIMNNVNSFGLNHLFMLLTVDELLNISDNMDLEVESTSKEVIIESIFTGKSFKPKRKKVENPSEKKPEIKEGISKVDLKHWFTTKDLTEWLKSKSAKTNGNKNQLIDRILKYLSGDVEVATQRKKRKRSRSKSPGGVKKEDEEKEESVKKRKLDDE